ncbi:MAG: hypothetical protein QOH14_1073 [Pseudonocardiales bacterium]|jgi:hypothetical protein|nr:hypothetical protein [Pseudonocardiales bacterium]
MTATMTSPSSKEVWNSMPGWGIVANLLPPEIIAARRIRVLRKRIVTALITVVVLCVAGYAYAFWQAHTATSALSSEKAQTSQLEREKGKYAEVVKVQGSIASVQKQISSLLGNDVDFAKLLASVVSQAPTGVAVSQLSVTINANTSIAAAGVAVGGGVLDTSGRKHIGSILLTGQASSVGQVADFVDRLSAVPGLVGVLPTSQQANGKAVQFALQLIPTDQVLSHRYDTATTTTIGGK